MQECEKLLSDRDDEIRDLKTSLRDHSAEVDKLKRLLHMSEESVVVTILSVDSLRNLPPNMHADSSRKFFHFRLFSLDRFKFRNVNMAFDRLKKLHLVQLFGIPT